MNRHGAMLILIATTAIGARAQTNLTIASVDVGGTLVWSYQSNDVQNYRVEWAPSPSGPWTSTWQMLTAIAPTGTTMTARVPMFYRVVASLAPEAHPNMSPIPQGSFAMGDTYAEGTAYELPVHTVNLSGYWADKYEVSKALWDEVRTWGLAHGFTDLAVGQGGFHDNQPQGTNHPVIQVTWYDCIKWCNARSQMNGLPEAYYTNSALTAVYKLGQVDIKSSWVNWTNGGFRLPTEAEWECAARGGLTGHHFPWPSLGATYADHITGNKANYWDSGDSGDNGTTPVGYYSGTQVPAGVDMANGYGLYDMAGNVDEWCWDRSGGNYPSAPVTNPRGPDLGSGRHIRGGSWSNYGTSSLRCARREYFFVTDAHDSFDFVGLRTVRSGTN